MGHQKNGDEIHPLPEKDDVNKIAEYPRHQTELSKWLGMANYHERFILQLHALAALRHQLASSKISWKWCLLENPIMNKIKILITDEAPVTICDENTPLILIRDASELGLGVKLVHTRED